MRGPYVITGLSGVTVGAAVGHLVSPMLVKGAAVVRNDRWHRGL